MTESVESITSLDQMTVVQPDAAVTLLPTVWKDAVQQFWNSEAQKHRDSPLATAPDLFYREREIRQISKRLRGNLILDVGCGNGYTLQQLAKRHRHAYFLGLDFSPEMIAHCKPTDRISFRHWDALDEPLRRDYFTTVFSERYLINLPDWPCQAQALNHMIGNLGHGGRLIVCENTEDGRIRLNRIRRLIGLPDIPARWHNRYLPEERVTQFLGERLRNVKKRNIGSTYYFLSRVLYAKWCQLLNKEPSYGAFINKIAAKLLSIGNLSACTIWTATKP